MAAVGASLSLILLMLRLPLGVYGLAFLLGGAASSMLYRRRIPGSRVTSGMGAKIGAASGAFAFAMVVIIAASSISRDQMRKMLEQQVSELTARGYSPEQAKMAIDLLKTPEGFAMFIIFSVVLGALIFVGASALGGALGARSVTRRNHQ